MKQINYYETHINGYLSALVRISSSETSYSCSITEIDAGIDSAVQNIIDRWQVGAKLISIEKLNYDESKQLLKAKIYDNLVSLEQSQIDLLDWDIQEYFGLVSTSINENGEFHPLVSHGSYELKFDSNEHIEMGSILVPVENFGVMLTWSQAGQQLS